MNMNIIMINVFTCIVIFGHEYHYDEHNNIILYIMHA